MYGVARAPRRVTREVVEAYTDSFTRAITDPEQRREYLSTIDHPDRPEMLPIARSVAIEPESCTSELR